MKKLFTLLTLIFISTSVFAQEIPQWILSLQGGFPVEKIAKDLNIDLSKNKIFSFSKTIKKEDTDIYETQMFIDVFMDITRNIGLQTSSNEIITQAISFNTVEEAGLVSEAKMAIKIYAADDKRFIPISYMTNDEDINFLEKNGTKLISFYKEHYPELCSMIKLEAECKVYTKNEIVKPSKKSQVKHALIKNVVTGINSEPKDFDNLTYYAVYTLPSDYYFNLIAKELAGEQIENGTEVPQSIIDAANAFFDNF